MNCASARRGSRSCLGVEFQLEIRQARLCKRAAVAHPALRPRTCRRTGLRRSGPPACRRSSRRTRLEPGSCRARRLDCAVVALAQQGGAREARVPPVEEVVAGGELRRVASPPSRWRADRRTPGSPRGERPGGLGTPSAASDAICSRTSCRRRPCWRIQLTGSEGVPPDVEELSPLSVREQDLDEPVDLLPRRITEIAEPHQPGGLDGVPHVLQPDLRLGVETDASPPARVEELRPRQRLRVASAGPRRCSRRNRS